MTETSEFTAEFRKEIEGLLRLSDQHASHIHDHVHEGLDSKGELHAGRRMERALNIAKEMKANARELRTKLSEVHLCEPPAEEKE